MKNVLTKQHKHTYTSTQSERALSDNGDHMNRILRGLT